MTSSAFSTMSRTVRQAGGWATPRTWGRYCCWSRSHSPRCSNAQRPTSPRASEVDSQTFAWLGCETTASHLTTGGFMRPLRVGLATVTASAAVVLAGCAGGSSEPVTIPGAEASPARVVRAYVAALNAHDDQAVRRLSTTPESAAWLDDVKQISNLKVTGVSPEKPQWSSEPAGTEVRQVGVRFDVDWGPFSDGSMENGHTVWGYGLKRDASTGRWVIFNEGVG
jgi:hypothetical protein